MYVCVCARTYTYYVRTVLNNNSKKKNSIAKPQRSTTGIIITNGEIIIIIIRVPLDDKTTAATSYDNLHRVA